MWLQRRRVVHFLKGLNPKFKSRRATMFHLANLPTMENAISAMVQEEVRLRVMGDNNPIRPAYAIPNDRECYNCGIRGHLSHACPSPQYGGRG